VLWKIVAGKFNLWHEVGRWYLGHFFQLFLLLDFYVDFRFLCVGRRFRDRLEEEAATKRVESFGAKRRVDLIGFLAIVRRGETIQEFNVSSLVNFLQCSICSI
jgi:hypothetical protein